MYFITPSKPGIFLIGIHGNQLYGFGEKNDDLCIYHKSIFDAGDWEEFGVIDVNVVKAECCDIGLHVAAGITDSRIWIAAREKKFTRIFSINILTKRYTCCKMLGDIYPEYEVPDLNLCCKCLMPIIRYQGYDPEFQLHIFLITPSQYKKEVGTFRIFFCINISLHCYLTKNLHMFITPSPLSSNVLVNLVGEVLFISEKSEVGRIKTLSISNRTLRFNTHLPDDPDMNTTWHDMTFFHDYLNHMFCITRRTQDDGNILLQISYVKFSVTDSSLSIGGLFTRTVDANFPSFESSPFFLSYHITDNKHPSSGAVFRKFQLDFIVFQTSVGIVTVPLRMLTLAESAYLSLRRIPEPPPRLPVAKVKFSIFQWIKWIISFFWRRTPMQVQHPWMSLNFISKALGLSNTFHLL